MGEYNAIAATGMLWDSATAPEQNNGYLDQVLDEITPTVFLSIETDELRHMANGYQTVVSIANDEAASKYLNTDLNNACANGGWPRR